MRAVPVCHSPFPMRFLEPRLIMTSDQLFLKQISVPLPAIPRTRVCKYTFVHLLLIVEHHRRWHSDSWATRNENDTRTLRAHRWKCTQRSGRKVSEVL